jgi:SPP1 gp7 family putative phage head morphogenesis protein
MAKFLLEDITAVIPMSLMRVLKRIYGDVFDQILSGQDFTISDKLVQQYAADRLMTWILGELSIIQARVIKQNKVIGEIAAERVKGFSFVRSPYTAAIEKAEKIFKDNNFDTINENVIKKLYNDSGNDIVKIHADAVQYAQTAIKQAMSANISKEDAIKQIMRSGVSKGYAENVYRTNTANAVNQAIYNKAVNSGYVDGFKFKAVGDSRTRQNHAAANNLEQPIDSDYWNYLYPPLGYNCRCLVIPIYAGSLKPYIPATIGLAKPDYPTFGKRPAVIESIGSKTQTA